MRNSLVHWVGRPMEFLHFMGAQQDQRYYKLAGLVAERS